MHLPKGIAEKRLGLYLISDMGVEDRTWLLLALLLLGLKIYNKTQKTHVENSAHKTHNTKNM